MPRKIETEQSEWYIPTYVASHWGVTFHSGICAAHVQVLVPTNDTIGTAFAMATYKTRLGKMSSPRATSVLKANKARAENYALFLVMVMTSLRVISMIICLQH